MEQDPETASKPASSARFIALAIGLFSGLSGVLLNFLSQVALAKLLGVSGYGQFALWRNNVILSSGLGTYSLNTFALQRLSTLNVAGDTHGIALFRRNTTSIVIALSAICALAIAVTQSPDAYPWFLTLACTVLYSLLALWAASNRALFGGLFVIFSERALQPSLLLIPLLVILALHYEGNQLVVGFIFLGSTALTVGVVAVTGFWSGRKQAIVAPGGTQPSTTSQEFLPIMRDGAPFFLISLSSFAAARMPLLIGAYLLREHELGQLAFMISLSGLLGVSLFSINLVAGPKIAAAFARKDFTVAQTVVRDVRLLAGAVGIAAAIGLIFAPSIIEFATNTRELVDPLSYTIFLGAGLIVVVFGAPSIYLQMTNQQKILARIFNVAVVAKIAVSIIFGTTLGLLGFALAEVVQATIIAIAASVVYSRSKTQPSI